MGGELLENLATELQANRIERLDGDGDGAELLGEGVGVEAGARPRSEERGKFQHAVLGQSGTRGMRQRRHSSGSSQCKRAEATSE